ncbi:aldose 1-epimerase [Thraustotheca clavata]|uniref:glucose-6-phosphate 1-epimerase n=1 Tax=Thraustotheca clavata TaxID=74557 RepID=A0A1V9Z913_9STRA|nr:aldose 1-epimerase [Thraustotheca clavata]
MSVVTNDGIVTLTHATSGATAQVHLYGATVTSFVPKAGGTDVLFVSHQAVLNGSKPIRGGIPLVFPQFGAGLIPSKLPSHGFARTSTWSLVETEILEASTSATFALSTTKGQLVDWPHAVRLAYNVTVAHNKLTTALYITNIDSEEWPCQALLHTYLRIDAPPSIATSELPGVRVHGLKGANYLSKVTGTSEVESRELVTIAGETDSVYSDANDTLVVQAGVDHIVRIEKRASLLGIGALKSDAVVWNPWTEKAHGLNDFADDEYPQMLCVEPGVVSRLQPLAPSQTLVLKQVLSVSD